MRNGAVACSPRELVKTRRTGGRADCRSGLDRARIEIEDAVTDRPDFAADQQTACRILDDRSLAALVVTRIPCNFSKSAGVYAEGWVLERRGHPQRTRLK